MVWEDEFGWDKVQRSAAYSVTGTLILDVGVKKAGRPITLTGQVDAGWIQRQSLRALYELAEAQPAAAHILRLADGREFTTTFAPDGAPIIATPIGRPELPPDAWPYFITLRLIEVAAPANNQGGTP
jgi:hypothetical protein